jgi:hypothetical protein
MNLGIPDIYGAGCKIDVLTSNQSYFTRAKAAAVE